MQGTTDGDGRDPGLDFRGARRLTGVEEWSWYLLAGSTYIVLGIWHKWLLNWFVGPAWLVAIIVVGPWVTDRLGLTGRRRSTRQAGRDQVVDGAHSGDDAVRRGPDGDGA